MIEDEQGRIAGKDQIGPDGVSKTGRLPRSRIITDHADGGYGLPRLLLQVRKQIIAQGPDLDPVGVAADIGPPPAVSLDVSRSG